MSPNLTFSSSSSSFYHIHFSVSFVFNPKLSSTLEPIFSLFSSDSTMAVGEVMRMEIPAGGELTVTTPELHVLAVDDSIVDRKVIERLLRISSCKVTTVESGTRALQYLGLDGGKGASNLKDLKVNLIVTDYSMPGLTGYDLLKKIKESSAFREVPVVIMSSENILPRIEECLKEGAEEFLLKPVKLADVKRIKQLIMRNEAEVCKTLSHSNKRKLQEDCDTSSSSSSSSSHDDSSVKDTPSSKRMKSESENLSSLF